MKPVAEVVRVLKLFRPVLIVILLYTSIWTAIQINRQVRCPPEILRETKVAGTDWIAQIRNNSCSFGSAEMIDLRVVKSDGHSPTVLATGYDIDLAVLDGTTPNHLRINIPQGRDITIRPADIRGLTVDFVYQPMAPAAPGPAPATAAKPE